MAQIVRCTALYLRPCAGLRCWGLSHWTHLQADAFGNLVLSTALCLYPGRPTQPRLNCSPPVAWIAGMSPV